jgi:hypothetical protein
MAGSNIEMNSLEPHRNELFRTDRMKGLEIQSMDIQTAETVGKANSVIYDTCTCGFPRQECKKQEQEDGHL